MLLTIKCELLTTNLIADEKVLPFFNPTRVLYYILTGPYGWKICTLDCQINGGVGGRGGAK